MLNFNQEIHKPGIARRLIINVVLFSSFITLLTTAMQLYRDYNNDIGLIEDHLQEVRDVHLKSITATLWASDTKELKIHLEGISQLRDMQFLEIRDQEKVWVSVGTPQSENVMSRQYPMIYTHRGRDLEIGTLTVVASLTGIYQRLFDKVWVILISNGIKTFLVAGFILIIFHVLITRHLIRIADFARTLDIKNLDNQLGLDRKGYRKQKKDELDLVVDAINQMQVNIKESFAALEQSEGRFQVLARVSPVGIFRTDAEGNCIYANERWRLLAGMTEAEALGDGWAKALHPEDRDRVFKEWYQATADQIPFKSECRFQRPDGKITWLLALAEAELDAEGQVVGYVGAITDITERKHTEETVRNIAAGVSAKTGEAFFQSLAVHLAKLFDADYAFIGLLDERTPDTVDTIALCVQGEIVDNISYTLAHTPCEHVVGGSCDVIRAWPRDIQKLFSEDQMLVEMGAQSYVGAPLVDTTGKPIGLMVLMDNKPMENPEQVETILEIFAARAAGEIERLRAEEELRKHRDHLEELVVERTAALETANKELESFSYSVSHDLRAPLRAIDGFSQAILEDYTDKLDDVGKDYLQRVRTGAQRMGELIDDLLTLSRVTRSKLDRKAVNLSTLAQDITALLKDSQPERAVTFVIAPDMRVTSDKNLLRVVIENLLDNAWKFTGKQDQAHIEFGAKKKDGETIYFVRDNGVGFDMKYADKLFGAFQRLHKPEEFEGTGIGLATVQRIIHRHGGRVWAEGEPGKGATFYFTLL